MYISPIYHEILHEPNKMKWKVHFYKKLWISAYCTDLEFYKIWLSRKKDTWLKNLLKIKIKPWIKGMFLRFWHGLTLKLYLCTFLKVLIHAMIWEQLNVYFMYQFVSWCMNNSCNFYNGLDMPAVRRTIYVLFTLLISLVNMEYCKEKHVLNDKI